MSSTTRQDITETLRIALPVGLGVVPLGVAFGLLVIQTDLSWWVAPALSVTAYAGSVEMLLVSLIHQHTGLATIAIMVFLLNSRHLFYAFTFPLHRVHGRAARLYSLYSLTDEAWAITAPNPEEWTHTKLLTLQIALQCYWVTGGLLGVGVGALLPARIEGLEFALCALFITLTADACTSRRQVPSLLLGALALALANVMFPAQALLAAMLMFVAFLGIRFLVSARHPTAYPLGQPDAEEG